MKVNIYEEDGTVIGRVEYTNNLDYWDGSNWTSGSTGRHKGLKKFGKNKNRYALIRGTQWQGEQNSAIEITQEEAMQEVLKANDDKLFEDFPELKELAKKEGLF